MMDALIGLGVGLGIVVYLSVGLLISILINGNGLETVLLFLFWPMFIVIELLLTFLHRCYIFGVCVKDKVYRRLTKMRKEKCDRTK